MNVYAAIPAIPAEFLTTTNITGGSSAPAPKFQTLPNGLRIVYERSPSVLPITSIQAFVHLGSANEVDGIRGVSHIIEHMVFKGTKRRPEPMQISQIFDETGAYMNAYTEKQFTCYVIKCQNHATKEAINTLSDMLFHSIMKHGEYIKEYDVVIEEAKKSRDDISNEVFDGISAMLYKGSSYENAIDDLSYHPKNHRILYEDAVNIYKSYYLPQNIVLSVVSSLPYSDIVKYIKHSYFSKALDEPQIAHPAIREPILYLEPIKDSKQYAFQKTKQAYETTNIAVGFRVCNMHCRDKYVLNLLKFVLVGPISSRFFHILRDENGLTYRTEVNINYYEHAGDFTIFTQVDNTKLMQNNTIHGPGLIPLLFKILRNLREKGISSEELEIAKGYMRGILTRNLEDNNNLADHNGLTVLFSYSDLYSYRRKYDLCYKKISRERINSVIRKYFRQDNMCVYICGNKLPVENVLMRAAAI